PRISPPEGVQAAHHVCGLIPGEIERTLPSARQACIPLECGVEASRGSQALLPNGVGWTWNLDAGPKTKTPKAGCHGSVSMRAHAVPLSLPRAYFSANRIVPAVPSRKVAGMRARPCHVRGPPVPNTR